MDHQTLLRAHYSLQKARTVPRLQRGIKKDDSDFRFFAKRDLLLCVEADGAAPRPD